jgi:multiple sugar transport system permease protein
MRHSSDAPRAATGPRPSSSGTAGSGVGESADRGTRNLGRDAFAGWLFSLPALLFLAAFLLLPLGLAGYLSLTNLRIGSPLPVRFVGLTNFINILKDAGFLQALRNNIVFAVVVVPVQTAISLALAILVNQGTRGAAFFRTLFFAPTVMGLTVVSTVWFLLYDPQHGLINGVLRSVTFGHFAPAWLQDPHTALLAVIITSMWASAGFQMVILLAALQAIPGELYEAAEIDGAGPLQRFRAVTMPGIRTVLVFTLTVTTIAAFRVFDAVYIMTGGGPLGASNTMLVKMVEVGYTKQYIGQASAMAVIFFAIVVAITLILRIFVREEAKR